MVSCCTLSLAQRITGFCSRRGTYFTFLPKHVLSACQFRTCAASLRNVKGNAEPTYEFQAGPWGNFIFESKHFSNIIIVPLNAHLYPAQNKVLVHYTKGDEVLDKGEVENIVSTTAEENVVVLKNVGDAETEKMSCHVQLPLKMDIKASLRGNTSIGIEKMESENLDLSLEKGTCLLKSIQGRDVQLSSEGGDIIIKSFIQGNIRIRAVDKTNIEAERIQGLSLDVKACDGKIHIKDVYADRSSFEIDKGLVHLGNCHRDAKVKVNQEGRVKIDSIDGNLTADVRGGDIDIFAVKHETIDVQTQNGNINVKVLDSANSQVNLKADLIEIDDQLHVDGNITKDVNNNVNSVRGHMQSISSEDPGNGSSRLIKAHTDSGNISVKCQDWLSSLNLMSK